MELLILPRITAWGLLSLLFLFCFSLFVLMWCWELNLGLHAFQASPLLSHTLSPPVFKTVIVYYLSFSDFSRAQCSNPMSSPRLWNLPWYTSTDLSSCKPNTAEIPHFLPQHFLVPSSCSVSVNLTLQTAARSSTSKQLPELSAEHREVWKLVFNILTLCTVKI